MNKFYSRLHNANNNFKKQFLRTGLLFFLTLHTGLNANAQCNNSNSSGTVTAPSPGNTVQINACALAGDYSTINSVTASTSYTVTSSTSADFITIRQGTPGGPLIAFGATPLIWTSASAGTYFVHINTDAGCGTQNTCRVTAITNNVCTAPVVNPIAGQVVCNNAATAAINFTGTATSYNWINNTTSIGLAASGTGNIASFTALNTSAVPVIATITVTPIAGTCSGTPASFTITVNPLPVVNVSPTSSCGGIPGIGGAPCNPLTASGNADTFIWSPVAGLYTDCTNTAAYGGGNLASVFASPTSFTVYTVTGTNAATGCVNTATSLVNYRPIQPIVTPNPAVMCVGDPAIKLKVTQPSTTLQYCSGPVNIAVPDNNPAGALSSINVSGVLSGCNITGVSVTINMQHTRVGDMVFVLRAPNGQILNLDYYLSGTGGNGLTTGFTNTVISTIGYNVLGTGSNPYTNTYKPDLMNTPGVFGPTGPTGMLPTATFWNSLYSIPNGTWTLGFYDAVTGETGTLNSWCLNITTSCPTTPAAPAVWTPSAGLFKDPAAAIPYIAGTQIDSVWARPLPAGTYTYQVITQSLPPALCTPTTNFASTNGNATVTFNIRNNHSFPITMSQIDSRTSAAGATNVSVYYKTSPVVGLPGAISSANGWIQIGAASITGTGTGVQPFITGLTLAIPAGFTYGICLQALTSANVPNLSYSALSAGNYSFNDGGCELLTGTNIGYSGTNVPAAPTTALSGFVGAVHFSQAIAACTSPPGTVVVTVGQATSITAQPANQNICLGQSAVFSVTASGSAGLTYQWQLSTNGAGGPYTNLVNAGNISGATTATLTIASPTTGTSGYYFRVFINGAGACGAVTSNAALLTVNPLPLIVISANPYTTLCTGQTTTISSIVSPGPAATYTWLLDGSVVTGATADTILVDLNGLGEYQLRVTDINGCTNVSNRVTIRDSTCRGSFVYPNPSNGLFQLRYPNEPNSVSARSIIIYNNMGNRVMTRSYTQTISYERIDIDLRKYGKGLYWVELVDVNGKRLSMSRVIVY